HATSETIRYSDRSAGIYRRLWLRNNRVQAAVMFGDTRNSAWYARLIEQQNDISDLRETLLLGEPSSEAVA
ncbi:MAG: hypothetical protein ABI645_12600, partial [Pseudomonadota bacterium]